VTGGFEHMGFTRACYLPTGDLLGWHASNPAVNPNGTDFAFQLSRVSSV
jgi:hypothetical protein